MKISELIPDDRNANKGTKRGMAALEKSLQNYGTGRSIVIDKNNRIIAGNKTAEMAVALGIEDIEVIKTDGKKIIVHQRTDLDLKKDKKARELAYADNRVSELDLEWDLGQIVEDSDFLDLSKFFEHKELDDIFEKFEKEQEEAEKEFKEDPFGLDFSIERNVLNTWKIFPSSNKYGIPDLLPNTDMEIPKKLLEYRENTELSGGECIHFFKQDYRFESVWTYPTKTFRRIKKIGMALSPDFSPYADYPLPLIQYNVYRNRWCGRFWQDNGIKVIPTATWNNIPEHLELCLAGIPKGSIICGSIVGGGKGENDGEKSKYLTRIYNYLQPKVMLVYGQAWNEYELPENIIKFQHRQCGLEKYKERKN